ncbi:FecCD family ABC transporter permease [Staphylococcus aureus]
MIHPIDAIKGIFTQDDFILNEYRIPRTLLGIIIGSSLAISGAIIQAVIRNPLASPDVIGISKGASCCNYYYDLSNSTIVCFTYRFILRCLCSKFIFIIFNFNNDVKCSKLALIGLAIGAICTAIVQFLLIRNPLEENKALVWLTGSLYGHDMSNIYTILPWFLITIRIIILLSYQLDVLNLGDAVATALGLKVKTIKMLLLILAENISSRIPQFQLSVVLAF